MVGKKNYKLTMTYQPIDKQIVNQPDANADSVQVPEVEYHPMETPQYQQYPPQFHQQEYIQYPPPDVQMNDEGYSFQHSTPQTERKVARTIVLGEEPTVCYCPKCNQPVQTRVEKHPSIVQYLMVLITWFCFVFFAFFWLTCPCLKDTHHVCTRCHQAIGKKGDIVAIE